MVEAKNIIENEKIKNKLNELKEATERVEKNLINMDSLITETVGQNVGVWDGESANQFRASWSNMTTEIPSYIDIFQKQVNNIQLLLEKTQKVDSEN